MRRAALALAVGLWATSAPAQQAGWPNLDQLLFSTLTASGRAEASFWMPDQPDPATATRALGIVYERIPGSAGSVGIAVGLYQRVPQGWQYTGPVEGLFGQSPSDPAFAPTHIEVTTLMLGPNEPRCCPTMQVSWRIDLATRVAQRLN